MKSLKVSQLVEYCSVMFFTHRKAKISSAVKEKKISVVFIAANSKQILQLLEAGIIQNNNT